LELKNTLDNIKDIDVDLTPILSDVADIKQNINDVSNDLLNKIKNNISEITKLKNKDISFTNDISDIKNEIASLHIEDTHIFEIISELQSIDKTMIDDIKNINDEILSLKEKIEYLSGVNVDNFETLEGANRRLTALENADKEFKNKIDKINNTINNGINPKLQWLILI
jgi:chromosome segregation ATPase